MGDRGRQLPQGRDAMGVRERLSLFLRPPAFSHIHQGPNEFDHIAGWAENRVTYGLDLSDLAAWMRNSIADVEIYLFADCRLEAFCSSGPVIRMKAPLQFSKSRRPPCGIETQNAERFLGKVGIFASRRGNQRPPWPADKVERWRIDRLIPYAKNARTHTDAQVAAIASSIKEWGWTTPALVAEDGGLIAGHARVLAARQLGIAEIPVMVAAGWTEAQKRAYVLADNQLAITGSGWDPELLRLEPGAAEPAAFRRKVPRFTRRKT